MKNFNNNSVNNSNKTSNSTRGENSRFQNRNRKSSSIENEIHRIFLGLVANAGATETVVKEKAPKGVSCKGSINVFLNSDLERERHDREERTSRGFKARPVIKYSFYPDIYNPERIESVAIYCDDAEAQLISLKTRRTLFGHRVAKATIENGRRPFVDVKLAV